MSHPPLSERRGSGRPSAHGTAGLRAKSSDARLRPRLAHAPARMADPDGVSRVGNGPKDGGRGARMAVEVDSGKCSVLHALPRLMQILRVLVRRGFPGVVLGRKRWPSPKDVREAFEELGIVFLKFGQVLAIRTNRSRSEALGQLVQERQSERKLDGTEARERRLFNADLAQGDDLSDIPSRWEGRTTRLRLPRR